MITSFEMIYNGALVDKTVWEFDLEKVGKRKKHASILEIITLICQVNTIEHHLTGCHQITIFFLDFHFLRLSFSAI